MTVKRQYKRKRYIKYKNGYCLSKQGKVNTILVVITTTTFTIFRDQVVTQLGRDLYDKYILCI